MTISYDPPSVRPTSTPRKSTSPASHPLEAWVADSKVSEMGQTSALRDDASSVEFPLESPEFTPPAAKTPFYLPGSGCPIKPQVSLAGLTSYRVGGPAQWYVAPRCPEDLQISLEWAKSEGLPVIVLGAGSNLLVSDRGLPGLVVGTRHLRHIRFDPEIAQVQAGAGVPIAQLARLVAQRGWQGLEWAVGIPGTVGGAIVMNAGAHESCIADVLVDVDVLSPAGNAACLGVSELGYRYRTSRLQGGDRVVTQATFQLQPGGDPQRVMATTEAHLERRRTTQPYHLPSCGSVFRNPEPYKAAWLIEQTGLKGYQIGGAQVSQLHANFILNCGKATASDIYQLMRYVQQQVEQRWSIRLEPEVKILGEF
ncbi:MULTISPECIES: UDP-N-acetylmuramate dehydrogenase [Desertifilum]|nr:MULTISPECIES: UDP-N-acetylmuramate dehydrogenase [Desertifilum]MDA0213256.1 UDP-N-acetylmuramate dehydrogenase [Cyanobacteria bacterium FC1]